MLDKLENLLLKWIEPEKPRDRPKKVTLLIIREMERVYSCLKRGQKAEFIVTDLVPYLKKCGVNVDECGIGYIAYL